MPRRRNGRPDLAAPTVKLENCNHCTIIIGDGKSQKSGMFSSLWHLLTGWLKRRLGMEQKK